MNKKLMKSIVLGFVRSTTLLLEALPPDLDPVLAKRKRKIQKQLAKTKKQWKALA